MMWRRLKSPGVWAVVLVGVIAAVAMWPEAVEVDLATAERRTLTVTIDEEGETRVRDRYVVSAPVAGELQRVELEPGDAVTAGSVVARLAPTDAPLIDPRTRAELAATIAGSRAALSQARAERDRVAASLELSRGLLRRRELLAEAGAIAREELESAQSAVETGEGALRAAEAAVAQARSQLQAAEARLQNPVSRGGRVIDLRAPVDGVVLKRLHESAAVVPAGEALIEIGDPSRLEVVSDLLSTDAVRVSPGQEVRIEQWGGGHPLHGRVRRVEPSGFMKVSALGVEEQRVNVIIDFADPETAGRALGDRYRVEVRVITWRGDDVLTVPVGSLFRRGDGWATFVVEEGTARLREVEVGHRNSEFAEILHGLEAHDPVVLHPPDTLADGMRVSARR